MISGLLALLLLGPPVGETEHLEPPQASVDGSAPVEPAAPDTTTDAAPGVTPDGEPAPAETLPAEAPPPAETATETATETPGQLDSSAQVRETEAAETETPPSEAEARVAVEPPAPNLPPATVSTPPRVPPLRRCLPNAQPCYRKTSARLLLAGIGVVTIGASLAAIFMGSDRQGIGDPGPGLAGAGVIAAGGATIGGLASLAHLDGPAVEDRITPATIGLGLGLGGADFTDELLPYSISGSIAPTWYFPKELGRLRLLGRVGGQLGKRLERDPRPQTSKDDGSFQPGLESQSMSFEAGLDLAFSLPYPLNSRPRAKPAFLGQFELRYKPLFFFSRDSLRFAAQLEGLDEGTETGGEPTISQRVALTPLNFGLRWNVTPRERFTVYMGPRWDLNGYGAPGDVVMSKPNAAPIYTEAWFDIDLRIHQLLPGRRASVVGQFTVGYIHSRFYGIGLNFGAIVGFLGPVVSQFSLRVRPRGSIVAYQFELGVRAGGGINPFLRAGIVLPSLGG